MPYIGNVLTSFAVETGNINDQAVTAPKLSATGGTDGQVLALDSNLNLEWVSDPSGQWVTGTGGDLTYSEGDVGIGVTSPTSILDVRDNQDGAAAEIKLFNLDQGNTTTQTAALVMTPDVRANGATISVVKENADFSSSADKDVAITFAPVLNNAATERMRIDSSGRLLQGKTATKGSTGENVPTYCTEIASNNPNVLEIANNGTNSSNSYSALVLSRSDGTTVNSHTAVDSSDKIGEVCFIGADGSDRFNTGAAIAAFAQSDFSANDCPTHLTFSTNGGSATAGERMRIDSSGLLLVGATSGRNVGGGANALVQVETTSQNGISFVCHRGTSTSGSILVLGKSRGTAAGSNTIVASGDELGALRFAGADGTDVESRGGEISCEVDGTPGSNDMPGRLIFKTTADNASSSTERMRISSDGTVAITDNLTVNDNQYPTAGALSHRNMIINGAMTVAQRGTGDFPIGDDDYPVDRFLFSNSGSGFTGGADGTQSTTAPAGFKNSLEIDITTEDTSLTSDSQGKIEYRVEGNDSAHLNWGTANAQTVTLSFHIRSNRTGESAVAFVNEGNNRSYVATFNINAANTWERKELTVPGPTDGTWNTSNGIGIRLRWGSFGSNFQTTSTNQWLSSQRMTSTSSINFFSSTDNNLFLTGVQLELGQKATPFEHKSFADELAGCQRYYYEVTSSTANKNVNQQGVLLAASATAYEYLPIPPVPMRAAPSCTLTDDVACMRLDGGATIIAVNLNGTDMITLPNGNGFSGHIFGSRKSGSGFGVGNTGRLMTGSTAGKLAFSAEL